MLKKRESNIELLRICAMVLIIMYHYCLMLDWNATGSGINKVFAILLGSWGALGVNIFIVITSWFSCDDKSRVDIWKELNIAFETMFYAVAAMVIVNIVRGEAISFVGLTKAILTPFLGNYWFITAYLCFYLLIPILKIVVNNISMECHRFMVILLTVVIVFFQMVIRGNSNYGILSIFAYLFVLVSYLKRIPENFLEKHALGIALGDYLLISVMLYFSKHNGSNFFETFFGEKHSIFIIIEAIAMFYCFRRINIGSKRSLNIMASSVFGIYILHQNRLYLDWMWNDVFHINAAYQSVYFIWYLIITTVIILISGAIIDIIRQQLLENPFMLFLKRNSLVNHVAENVNMRLNDLTEGNSQGENKKQ